MKINWSEPGVPLSAAIHAALLLATLIAFSNTPKFEDQPESIAVEMVTADELTKMTKGDKTVKEIKPDAKIKADKVAEEELIKQETADAKKDIPTPPAKAPEPQPAPD
ncbi:MAG: cell envelope biogenesis protein TolA, partial [Beijerinckiaceae bacterium]|nr:cell envelope biogenesis protein TolA [Beijerinckiaceae bacterium]